MMAGGEERGERRKEGGSEWVRGWVGKRGRGEKRGGRE